MSGITREYSQIRLAVSALLELKTQTPLNRTEPTVCNQLDSLIPRIDDLAKKQGLGQEEKEQLDRWRSSAIQGTDWFPRPTSCKRPAPTPSPASPHCKRMRLSKPPKGIPFIGPAYGIQASRREDRQLAAFCYALFATTCARWEAWTPFSGDDIEFCNYSYPKRPQIIAPAQYLSAALLSPLCDQGMISEVDFLRVLNIICQGKKNLDFFAQEISLLLFSQKIMRAYALSSENLLDALSALNITSETQFLCFLNYSNGAAPVKIQLHCQEKITYHLKGVVYKDRKKNPSAIALDGESCTLYTYLHGSPSMVSLNSGFYQQACCSSNNHSQALANNPLEKQIAAVYERSKFKVGSK